MNTILLWMILIATVIMLFIVINGVFSWLFEQDPEEASCAVQVLASKTISSLTKGDHALGITCPSRKVIVPPLADEDTNRVLAEEMRSCWKTWGEGKDILFEEDGIYCHICSYITFEQPGTLPDFGQFLATEKPKNEDITYLEYFQPGFSSIEQEKSIEFENKKYPIQTGSVDKSKPYASIFYHVRGEKQINLFLTQISQDSINRPLGTAGGFLVGGGLGGAAAGGSALLIGCGAISGGLCWAAVGVGVVAVGIPSALIGNYLANHPPEYASFIVFRQLDFENIQNLGCEYSFAARG